MPSVPRLGSLLPARPSADRPSGGLPSATKRATQGALLAAIVVGSMAFASHAVTRDDAAEAPANALATLLGASPADGVRNPFAEGSRSEARDGVGVSVLVDGEVVPVLTAAGTVGAAIEAAGVELGPDDVVVPGLEAAVPASGEIVVSRVTFEDRTERSEVPFATVEQPDAQVAVGERSVVTAGQPGGTVVVYRVRLVDGVETGREEVFKAVSAPVDEVVRVGAEPRSIARAQVAARGWGADQFSCLDRLWTKESNWNPSAQNRSSGAYGIPQALPGSKMGTVAADWRTNPATQITWGLNYIEGRYGTPCGAWAHSQAVNWY